MTNHVERNKQLAREWYALIGSARYEEAKAYVSDDFVYYPMMWTHLSKGKALTWTLSRALLLRLSI